MKQKLIFGFSLCLFCTISFSNLSAQEYKNFDLNKYFTPDIVRRSLGFNGSILQNLSLGTYQSASSFDGNLSTSFRSYTSTRKLVKELAVGAYLNGGGSGEERFYEKLNTKSGSFSNYDYLNMNYQFYNKSNYFLSAGVNLHFSYGKSSSSKTDSLSRIDINTSGNKTYMGNLSVGVGRGRIELVTDARQALYLIEAFQKNGRLKRDVSQSDIFKLSHEMSKVKNKRFLDSRLKLIEEITKVDSFFVSNGFIEKQDASYFSTLYDIWMNGANFERKTGQVLEFKVNPYIRVNNSFTKADFNISNNEDSELKSKNTNQNHQIGIYYSKENCFNVKWQESFDTHISGDFVEINEKSVNVLNSAENVGKSSSKNINLGINYILGFYPNTRTNIYFQAKNDLDYPFYYISDYNDNVLILNSKSIYNVTELSLGAYYYFSPQLRITARASILDFFDINNIDEKGYTTNRISNNFSIGFSYSMF